VIATLSQRRKALLDVLEEYEKMNILLSCLTRSPCFWSQEDTEERRHMDALVEIGHLSTDGDYCTTTLAGRDALIAFVRGEDVTDKLEQGEE
jgi:hypothetical protein